MRSVTLKLYETQVAFSWNLPQGSHLCQVARQTFADSAGLLGEFSAMLLSNLSGQTTHNSWDQKGCECILSETVAMAGPWHIMYDTA